MSRTESARKGAEKAAVSGRQRRSGMEVRALIERSARAAFAEHGFAGATTRAIAQAAGASEVLIYRYFGSKTALFEEVVLAPFNRLIDRFLDEHRNDPPDRLRGNEAFVRALYPFLRDNADLLQALVKSHPAGRGGDGTPPGLDGYFTLAAERMRSQYGRDGVAPEVAPELCVRFAFGMIAAAILFEDWFFPEAAPDQPAVTHALTRMLFKAMAPATVEPA